MKKIRGLLTTEFYLVLGLIVLSFTLEWQKLAILGFVIAVYVGSRTFGKADPGIKNYTIHR